MALKFSELDKQIELSEAVNALKGYTHTIEKSLKDFAEISVRDKDSQFYGQDTEDLIGKRMHISGDGRKIGSEIKTFINKDLLNEALKKGKVAVKDNYAEISPENLAKLLTKAGLEPVNQR